MLSLNEIFALRQQLREYLQSKQYEKLTQYFATAHADFKANRDNNIYLYIIDFDFLLSPKIYSHKTISQYLIDWHQAQPMSSYPCQLLAQHWLTIAGEERGGQYAEVVSHNQWQRAAISNDLMFYWAAKAISLDSHCTTLYQHLLSATGHFQEPEWFRNRHETVQFDLAWYGSTALEFAQSKGGVPLSSTPFNTGLPEPSAEEATFAPLYWLNRALECDAQNIVVRTLYINYLYPRWYGDEKHQAIDAFLAGDYCKNLSEPQRNILYRTKMLDKVNNIEHWPDYSNAKKLKQHDEKFRQLLSLNMPAHDMAVTHIIYIGMCSHFLLDNNGKLYAQSPYFARRIYDSIGYVLNSDQSWVIYSLGESLILWLSEIPSHPDYQVADTDHLLKRYLEATQGNGENHTELVFSAFARLYPTQDIQLQQPADWWLQRLLDSAAAMPVEMLGVIFKRLCGLGHAAAAKDFLLQLSAREYLPGTLLLTELFAGQHPKLAERLELAPAADKAEYYLDIACRERSAEALFRKSRALEEQALTASSPAESNRLNAERITLLVEASDHGHAMARYDYACALFWSDDVDDQRFALEQQCALLLLDGKVGPQQTAYIAYLYAYAAWNGRGMAKNMWLAKYWIEYAQSWDDAEDYRQMRRMMTDYFTLRFIFRIRAKQDASKVPAWQMDLVNMMPSGE
ncbi:DUF4034 domain-containing protein [Erwiniaceae bacterium BAC15a-03b]|uniref:DUF4034 domain-containing protein n=1 Tax=Winslowiella arboricola TaxID=2978220 RepID=A0A9J6PVT5_9GAMM|nr:DUF4034 domain-containing protein [Winslowiella arboricola]MCU5771668.1 DUF4034 domain-containing protein [Winslowiella arboricola]MCU5778143.1 DUF4034 domain-containing protein [Winslowiella arboricola]